MLRLIAILLAVVSMAGAVSAQTPAPVPREMQFSGRVVDAAGQPVTGRVPISFGIYHDQEGGFPLWVETQTVELDSYGQYIVLLGATTGGIAPDVFANSSPRWLSVQPDGLDELPRVRLLAVPYALKAADADTLGGLSVSQFVRVEKDGAAPSVDRPAASPASESDSEFVRPLQTINEDLFVTGNLGVGTLTPTQKMQVNGTVRVLANAAAGGGLWLDGLLDMIWASSVPTPAAGHAFLWHNSTTGGLEFKFSNGTSPLKIDDNTGVRINGNTAAGTGLMVDGVITLPWGNAPPTPAAGNAFLFHSYPADAIEFKFANGATPLRIDNDLGVRVTGNTATGIGLMVDGVINLPWGNAPPVPPAGSAYLFHSYPADAIEFKFANGVTPLKVDNDLGVVVTGNVEVSGNMNVIGNIAAKYQDVAEWVDAVEDLEPGTVVVIDETASNRVRIASTAYATAVAGAISPQPGVILGEPGPGRELVAQSGRVRIKVDASFGAIRAGDLLVTSPTPGHAMKSMPVEIGGLTMHRPGTLVGKALESLPAGRGEILVLITLQ